jgi:hypothetical protein
MDEFATGFSIKPMRAGKDAVVDRSTRKSESIEFSSVNEKC